MNDSWVRPYFVPCGRCGASVSVSWRHFGDGDWSGMGRCGACGSGVLSLFSGSGIPAEDLAALFDDFPSDEVVAMDAFYRVRKPPKPPKAALIA